jgi:hypothetical protein
VDKNTEQKLKRIWCERLVIGLFASTALGFFIAKIPTVYGQMQAQAQYDQAVAQALAQYDQAQYDQAVTQAVTQAVAQDVQAGRAVAHNKQVLAQAHYKQSQAQYKQAVTQAHYKQAQAVAQAQVQALQSQFTLLGISALCFLMLLLLLRRNQISLPLTGQLIIVLPEECIVELEDFHQQIKFEKRSAWVIRMIMLWTVLELLWALHIQINVENLWLPKSRGHTKIDE